MVFVIVVIVALVVGIAICVVIAIRVNSFQALLTDDLAKFVSGIDVLVGNVVKVVEVVLEQVAFTKVSHVTHLASKDLKPQEWFDSKSQVFVGFKFDQKVCERFFESIFKLFLQYQDDFAIQNASDFRSMVLKHTQEC